VLFGHDEVIEVAQAALEEHADRDRKLAEIAELREGVEIGWSEDL
jgi:hypothetical protein